MTSSKALYAIENHVKNEKLLNFQEKQDYMVLMDFVKQLPNLVVSGKED